MRATGLGDHQNQRLAWRHTAGGASEQVVPGDVTLLSAGSLLPADGIVLKANDLFVNQAVLTGETFPVENTPGHCSSSSRFGERTNCVFMGTGEVATDVSVTAESASCGASRAGMVFRL